MINTVKSFFILIALVSSFCESSLPLRIRTERIGSTVKLTCIDPNLDEGKENVEIVWEKPKGNIFGKGPDLVLKNVQNQQDLEQYICSSNSSVDLASVKYRVFNDDEQSEVIFDELPAPDIVIPQAPNNKVTLQETENLDIECKVSNWLKQDYNVQWMKSTGDVVSDKSRLFIESVVQRKHGGTYICAVMHEKQDQIYNKKIEIIIIKPKLSIQILSGEKLQINGMIHRKCVGFNFKQSTETFSYTWFDSQGRVISITDTIQVPINDATVFGSYECQYKARKSGETYYATVQITDEGTLSSLTSAYLITITPYPEKFRLKEKFSMRCQVMPPLKNMKYWWYKNDKSLVHHQETIVFDKFTRPDLGVYKCVVVGLNEQYVTVQLEAKSYQRLSVFVPVKVELIERAGSQVAVILSRKKELHCDVSPDSGHSGAEVKWSFENQKLSKENALKMFNISRVNGRLVSILVLNNAQIVNEGHYQCHVGGVTKSVNIVVIQDEGLLIISPSIQRRDEGKPAEFHCRVNDIPNLKNTDIKWFFQKKNGSQRIALPNHRWTNSQQQIAEMTSFISTESVNMDDNGYFICTVPTGQESQAEIIVEEKLRPFFAKAIPPTINVTINQKFEFECLTQDRYGNPNGEPLIKFLNGSLVSKDSRFIVTKIGTSRIKLTAPFGVQIAENQLKLTCGVEERYSLVTVNIRNICPPYHRHCRLGECVANNKFCDGIINCADGSDEDVAYCNSCDPISKPCGSVTGNKTTKQYFNINWACDGESDCANGFDERHCNNSNKCRTQQFTCNDGKKIPHGYLCDLSTDCNDGEDEIGCVKPQILTTSEKYIKAKIGSTITLKCEVLGHPLPTVAWRFNWNCLPDESRMTINELSDNCKKIVSVLTLNNFQPGDDAIYNCEAVGSGSRALSEPFQVTVDN